ncbi:unnamed protein product, partial [Vitis vinifera]
MEATLFSFPSTKPPPPKTLTLTQSKTLTLTYPKSLNPYRRTSYSTTIRSAISRTKKEETVQTVKEQLENCHLLAAIKYNGFTVQQFQELRRSLPEKSKLIRGNSGCHQSMPTRAEIYAKLLGALQSPASALVGTLQAPARDLVMVLKAYVKKLEEEG